MTSPNSPPDWLTPRLHALDLAVIHHQTRLAQGHHADDEAVVRSADAFWRWLLDPTVELIISVSEATKQGTPPSKYFKEMTDMAQAITLKDDEQVAVGVLSKDAKGYTVTDDLTWNSDSLDIVGIVESPDDDNNVLLVAGAPGNAVVTVTDGTREEIIAVTVTAGDAVALAASVGTVEKQPATPPVTEPSDTVTTPPPADDSTGGDTTTGDSTGVTTGSETGTDSTGTTDGAAPSPVVTDTDSGPVSTDVPDSTEAAVPSDGSAAPLGGPDTAAGPGAAPDGGITPPAQVGS